MVFLVLCLVCVEALGASVPLGIQQGPIVWRCRLSLH